MKNTGSDIPLKSYEIYKVTGIKFNKFVKVNGKSCIKFALAEFIQH